MLSREMHLYTNYLIGAHPTQLAIKLFAAGVAERNLLTEKRTIRMIECCIKYPALIGFFDAATGMFERDNEWRKRLILAFAILETQPEYYSLFRPQNFSFTDKIMLLLQGAGSLIRAITGKLLLWMI